MPCIVSLEIFSLNLTLFLNILVTDRWLVCYRCDSFLQINDFKKSQSASARPMTVEEVAMGFIQVANEAMCRPIRTLTQVIFVIRINHQ